MLKNRSKDGTCKTNLIVTPKALLGQWKMEIDLKTNNGLRCLIYHGKSFNMNHNQYLQDYLGSGKVKRKVDLLAYDVVLTTFQVSHNSSGHSECWLNTSFTRRWQWNGLTKRINDAKKRLPKRKATPRRIGSFRIRMTMLRQKLVVSVSMIKDYYSKLMYVSNSFTQSVSNLFLSVLSYHFG